jgi:hypothetical protein
VKPLSSTKSQLHQILKVLTEITTDADSKARAFRQTKQEKKLSQEDKYFRYSVPQGLQDVDLGDFEKIPLMEALTIPYTQDMDDSIESCAKSLVNPQKSC